MSKLNPKQQHTQTSSAVAGGCRVYASEGENLIVYDLNPANATLARIWSITLPAFVQAGSFHSARHHFYVALSKGGYAATNPIEEHYLAAFKIETTGALTLLDDYIRLPSRPVHICLDHAGEHVLVAYNHPAGLSIHTILQDGGIEKEFQSPKLSLRNYPHQVMVAPNDSFVTICATGQEANPDPTAFRGAIHVLEYNHGKIGDELGSVTLNDGLRFSPRHLEFHPTLPLAYVSLERQNELHVYRYGPAGFEPEPIFVETTLFGGASKGWQFCGTVRIHPNGRFVYVTNRTLGWFEEEGQKRLTKGGDDVAVFEIEALTGRLIPLQRINSEGIMPRTMSFDATGRMLVVANQFEVNVMDENKMTHISQSLVLYRIADDGTLHLARKYELDAGQKPMIWMDVL
jgi:6-phosphogluconolactonase (cycloisomerase 2 family)